ncbi:MAG: riboflavin synthase [Deltaproteobacteria bacterium]|nr:riboflavin synthase [Candidatus Anaeroferrophillus wilburensis]MBN2889161.1 riboflavin synthase [Deltaproteobacteria bacterium]
MFTGIIEEIGSIEWIDVRHGSGRLAVQGEIIRQGCHLGDSIAVNGTCLTVVEIGTSAVSFDVSAETVDRSTIGLLQPGDPVNLERAMAANGRFGGHMVSGHIDGTGTIAARSQDANATLITITAPPAITRLLIEKGSIAVDGISLTVAACSPTSFSVAIIPHTLNQTTLRWKKTRDRVNLENDLVGKYIYSFLHPETLEQPKSAIDHAFLKKHGFA